MRKSYNLLFLHVSSLLPYTLCFFLAVSPSSFDAVLDLIVEDIVDGGLDPVYFDGQVAKHERVVYAAAKLLQHVSPSLLDHVADVVVDDVFGFVGDVSDLVNEFRDHVVIFALALGVVEEEVHEPQLVAQRCYFVVRATK